MNNEQMIHRAVTELAERCDGARVKDEAGFNKPDSFGGIYLAAVPVERWSAAMLWNAWKMTQK